MLRQRRVVSEHGSGRRTSLVQGPATGAPGDSGQRRLVDAVLRVRGLLLGLRSRASRQALAAIDPAGGARLMAEAEAYRQDLRAAVERSIALSPVVPVRDGTFHSVIPFACYVRGLSTGAWGWQRDGSGDHVGPLYWETVQSAAALISPAGLLSADDVRVQGYLDVLEDRLLLENRMSHAKQRRLVHGRLAISGRTGAHREHASGRRRHPGLPPLLPELLCRRHPAGQRLHLQRTRGPRSAGQDLRGGRLPGTLPQPAGDGGRPEPVAGPGHAARLAGAGPEDQR